MAVNEILKRNSGACLRDAGPGDAVSLAALMGELGYPSTPEQMASRLAAIGAESGWRIFVAETGDAVVGLIGVRASPRLAEDGLAGYIVALVVGESARGMGVGRELVAAAEAWARERGAVKMVVTSQTKRAEAHRFYKGLGYALTGVRLGRPL